MLIRMDRASLRSAEDETRLRAIADHIGALETLCRTLESRLMSRDWHGLEEAIADSRRITHGLQNAMEDAVAARDELFDSQVFSRLRRVYAVRDEQMDRLSRYRDSVGERLRTISKWKGYARSIGAKDARPRATVGLDRLR